MATTVQLIGQLRGQAHELSEEGRKLLVVAEGAIYPCDAMALAVVDRSVQLVRGFIPLFKSENVIAGAALLRLQLDNALRFGAVSKSRDPHDLVVQITEGTQLDRTSDESGNRRTDGNLRKALNDPNFDRLYLWASGHIHLSGVHMRHLTEATRPRADGRRDFHIGGFKQYLPPETQRVLAESMLDAGARVVRVVGEWRNIRAPLLEAAQSKFSRAVKCEETIGFGLLP